MVPRAQSCLRRLLVEAVFDDANLLFRLGAQPKLCFKKYVDVGDSFKLPIFITECICRALSIC